MNPPLRFVTAASLFDGHDASINIMRRILQSKGAEVVHLGHNRAAHEVVQAAVQEDVHGIAISSYQGGHNEYFAYVRQLLEEQGCGHIKIFGGGGGVITPKEIKALEAKGVEKIYSPEDGRQLGLEGMIDDMIARASKAKAREDKASFSAPSSDPSDLSDRQVGRMISAIENTGRCPVAFEAKGDVPVLGLTGTGGAGKSSLIDELLLRWHRQFPGRKVALISVDPTKKRDQGALLGDRIRLGSASLGPFFIRSLATRNSQTELSPHIQLVVDFLAAGPFDLIVVETSGIGQASDAITSVADKTLYVMTPEYGAQTQLEKIEMLESADLVAINKFEKPRGLDALRDVRKQFRRNRKMFSTEQVPDEQLPIFGTIASRFNDIGVNQLFLRLTQELGISLKDSVKSDVPLPIDESKIAQKRAIIPPSRVLYLREIADVLRDYNRKVEEQAVFLDDYQALERAASLVEDSASLEKVKQQVQEQIDPEVWEELDEFDKTLHQYRAGTYSFSIRGKEVTQETRYESLCHSQIPRVGLPDYEGAGQRFRFMRKQNLPGFFPYAGGIFPFKRKDEDPKRMFAGEGGPKRTNKRFHYLSQDAPAKRLSTAFDSVTLYGEDPAARPDIYGKVGESGVSICTLKDMQDLFAGFDLTGLQTSVSMTINGPAPIILALFMNAAINQKLGEEERDDQEKSLDVMRQVRGTVQADILKEDQAQNTCIFSLDFALKLMGDVQEYFCRHQIRNYYTVSISGYHIAEAGANPITQLAFTLANGFTYVEYYLGRGLKIDDFADNLSFFFSNGLDPEYTVIGRVARKIWAVALRDKYGAGKKSQRLKYHIQTSGRSLHAKEINFNDIRTTLQAFLALSDNCNSLHTNAFDEAITTPTEKSVRRAMAIQLIINREFGLNKTDNPLQGSFIYDELADLVEEAVLTEFEKISDRGGVLGAMESMYQRSQIQEESLHYETQKDSGQLPVVGVNCFLPPKGEEEDAEVELTRSNSQAKDEQIQRLRAFQEENKSEAEKALNDLRKVALEEKNIFEELMKTTRVCSLGQITQVLYEVGGAYRRNI